LDIFLCEEDESEHNFAGEFEYFTKTIDQYIEQKKMIPLNVKMYKVNDETLSKVQEYYTRDLDFDDRFFRDVLGIERYQGGIYYFDQEELGNPPNIVLQFDKQTEASLSNNFDEYLRRRKALEDE
ncbi:MAG: hypothetical protein K5654_03240, partial [Lachnospiraceae bacterium]|nr:hypothetical protein [Lachnospiraceae bacterium]